jgi:hypothetical protein
VKPSNSEIDELAKLTNRAEELLNRTASSSQPASKGVLRDLESIAGLAAQIAYRTGNPELLTDEMTSLIAWTDHLDDPSWISRFQKALSQRPLVSPWHTDDLTNR